MVVIANAQQDPLYAQYMNNPFLLNPAYAGFQNNLSTSVGYRQQWSGMEGPKTFNVTADMSIMNRRGGAGLVIVTDRIGASSRSEIMTAYSYKIPLSTSTTLSFGMQGGIIHYKIDYSKLAVYDLNDPLFGGNEDLWRPNAGAGLVVNGERFLVAVSVPRLFESSASVGSIHQTVMSRHYYFSGAYIIPISPKVVFKPSTLLRYVPGAPISADVAASFIFNERFQSGVFTRNINTLGALLQIAMNDNFLLGYIFEVPTRKALPSNFVTHEFTLTLKLSVLNFHEPFSSLDFE